VIEPAIWQVLGMLHKERPGRSCHMSVGLGAIAQADGLVVGHIDQLQTA
jgi:hypothetical protein